MNIGNPSPQEIYDSYSQIPNTPQGKQSLANLIQAFKNSGDMRGSIATSILNSYNSQQPPAPPPPQGQVADKVVSQASPYQMGIAAQGLDLPQGMASGGLVAFAGGGPVRGFWDGGDTSLYSDLFGDSAPDVPDAPDITPYVQDYISSPQAQAPATPSRSVSAGDSGRQSYDERLQNIMDLYGAPPDIAAELISKHEHNQAKREKFNTFENIASALSGYLGAYGTGAHRAGVGIASMLGTMGQHDKAAAEDEASLDALRYKAAMQPYEMRKGIIDQLQAQDAAHAKAQQEAALKLKIAQMEQQTALGGRKISGEYGLRKEEMQNRSAEAVGAAHNAALVEAAKQRAGVGKNITKNQAYDKAAIGFDVSRYESQEEALQALDKRAEEIYRKNMGSYSGSSDSQSSSQTSSFGTPYTFTTPSGVQSQGWLR